MNSVAFRVNIEILKNGKFCSSTQNSDTYTLVAMTVTTRQTTRAVMMKRRVQQTASDR